MRSRFFIFIFGIAALTLSACGSGNLPLTPNPDRPTFLFFYTDG